MTKLMARPLQLLVLALVAAVHAKAGATVAGKMRRGVPPQSDIQVDFVIDLDTDTDNTFDVIDVEEEGDDETATTAAQATLCIAPPCGLKMDAVPRNTAPVPWLMRLMRPMEV